MAIETHKDASLNAQLSACSSIITSQPGRAARRARALLRENPDLVEARLLLARALRAQGDPRAAIAALKSSASSATNAESRHIEGLALIDVGDSLEAITALEEAAALNPALAGVWLVLAEQFWSTGNHRAARDAYERHILNSASAPHVLRAARALHGDNLHEAADIVAAHLRGWPNDVAALAMQGEIFARLGALDDAATIFERCLDLYPGYKLARQNYATLLLHARKPGLALAQADLLLAESPDDVSCRSLRADCLAALGQHADAIGAYEHALTLRPREPRPWIVYGNLLKEVGRQADAIKAYRTAIATAPASGEAWWSIANLKTIEFTGTDIQDMERLLEWQELDASTRIYLHFALGKAFEDEEQYETSFSHYRTGNILKRKGIKFDVANIEERVRENKESLTRHFFDARKGSGSQSMDPIFIVGLPRSGSTLVEQILASHSQLEGTSELPFILEIAERLGSTARKIMNLSVLDPHRLRELGEQYLRHATNHRKLGRLHFIDKMPNNFLHIGLIHLILPNAKIIDVRRDPMACCFSNYKQLFVHGQHFSFDLSSLGRYYKAYIELMAHFDCVLPGRVHKVEYEQLVFEPEREIRSLLAHCNLRFEPGCLRFHENDRAVRTASSEQVRLPIGLQALDQWRNFEPWLNQLKLALDGW